VHPGGRAVTMAEGATQPAAAYRGGCYWAGWGGPPASLPVALPAPRTGEVRLYLLSVRPPDLALLSYSLGCETPPPPSPFLAELGCLPVPIIIRMMKVHGEGSMASAQIKGLAMNVGDKCKRMHS